MMCAKCDALRARAELAEAKFENAAGDRNVAREQRDEYQHCWQRDLAKSREIEAVLRAELCDVTAERDSLRARASLPVIVDCWGCGHADRGLSTCDHPQSHGAGDEIVNLFGPPPSDCPLRKAGA